MRNALLRYLYQRNPNWQSASQNGGLTLLEINSVVRSTTNKEEESESSIFGPLGQGHPKVGVSQDYVGSMLLSQNLLTPLFLRKGCFPGIFERENGPLRHSGKRPIQVGKRPIKEGKRPIKLNGLFSGTPPWRKTAPLKRPIKRSMILVSQLHLPSRSYRATGGIAAILSQIAA